jgi:hypothetical protein
MGREKKLLIFLLILGTITTVVYISLVRPAQKKLEFYIAMDGKGIGVAGRVLEKEVAAVKAGKGGPRESCRIYIAYSDDTGRVRRGRLEVSRSHFDRIRVNDVVPIMYLKEYPEAIEIAAHVVGHRDFYRSSLRMAWVLWFIIVLAPLTVGIIMFLKAREGGGLASFTASCMKCPECGLYMEEGYLPLGSGINWRRKGERAGMITNLSGLPGTVWKNPFNPRPRLAAFQCPQCHIVIFKYPLEKPAPGLGQTA